MEKVDITIIGAGVIGLSVASQVASKGKDVFILEKNHSWGQETSSRNSEVIHAGIYYLPGSLKAKVCYEGRRLLYSLCPQYGIRIKKTGKMIVAIDDSEIKKLEELKETAKNNGVDLEMIGKKDIKKLEPQVFGEAALFSPETGIVDSHFLMKHFLDEAQAKGAQLVCEAEVVGVEKKGSFYRIVVDNQGERIDLESRIVINCAGNSADKVALLAGIDIEKCGYEQYYLKGSYFRLADRFRNSMHTLVYPVPEKNSLGIHTVLDLDGGIRLGPDEEKVETIDYQVDLNKRKGFFEAARKYWPGLREEDLSSDMAGVRPQLCKPNRGNFKDFIIKHEEDKGFPGLINLIGIESPGLTASVYIGRYVAELAGRVL